MFLWGILISSSGKMKKYPFSPLECCKIDVYLQNKSALLQPRLSHQKFKIILLSSYFRIPEILKQEYFRSIIPKPVWEGRRDLNNIPIPHLSEKWDRRYAERIQLSLNSSKSTCINCWKKRASFTMLTADVLKTEGCGLKSINLHADASSLFHRTSNIITAPLLPEPKLAHESNCNTIWTKS